MIARLLAAALALLPGSLAAQTVAIVNARILTMGPAGEIASGALIIRDGRIVAVGANVSVPTGVRRIDAGGKTVTPGLVAAGTALGLIEVRQIEATDDRSTRQRGQSAAFDAAYGLNPDSVLIPVARLGGITRAIVTPTYADGSDRDLLFAGQAAAISLGGDAILHKRGVAMVLEMGGAGGERAGGSRATEIGALKAIIADVRDFALRKLAYEQGATRDYLLSRADMEALMPVVQGRMPLLITVHRAPDIRGVLALARDERLKIILQGASEGWRVASEIAAARIPAMLTPIENAPSFETLGATLANAARLNAAGVTIGIQGNGNHREREMRYNAGNAVAGGLSHGAALAAITINPARIFGLADRIGSLEPGKDADVVIWDGDPLETLARPVAVIIRGREQAMTSRATELRDRYLPAIVRQ